MKNLLLLLCTCFGISACGFSKGNTMDTIDNHTVQSLDLNRFMGRWYEIARYDHRFEKELTHVSATYSLRKDGKIEVLNEGWKDGELKQIKGKAKQPDPNDPGKLKVSFFLWFYADYYVLEIDPDYQYVLIGSSSDKYLWIMSRDKTIPDTLRDELLQKLQARGYDTNRLVFVDQQTVK